MTPIFELIIKSKKLDIDIENNVPIYYSKIQMDNGEWVVPFPWQCNLLKTILSYSEYSGSNLCSLSYRILIGRFHYNILYVDGDVFLINIDTQKYRKFLFSQESH
tara:strand:- start:57 stop:371 length:315 start_codon:yes stop_codon:yes gene_type:complete